jgi:hypothetical protein
MLAFILAASAALSYPGNDPFAGSGCNCTTFCAGQCAIFPTAAANLSLYRMTPLHVGGATDKNTGDAPGDTSYIISRRTAAYDCKVDPTGSHCSSLVVAGDNPNSTDVIIDFLMEVDGEWGPDLYCNPTDAKHPDKPWNCTTTLPSGGGGGGGGGGAPANYPKVCLAANYSGFNHTCFSGPTSNVTTGGSLADCCTLAIDEEAWDYTYFAGNKTCNVLSTSHNHYDSHCDGGVGGHWQYPHPSHSTCECPRVHAEVGREKLSNYFPAGGFWYSHAHEGQCAPGRTVSGGSCAWRVAAVQRAINASCMYDRVDKNVEGRNTSCFAPCPVDARTNDFNRTS